jgi:hypothetical protein
MRIKQHRKFTLTLPEETVKIHVREEKKCLCSEKCRYLTNDHCTLERGYEYLPTVNMVGIMAPSRTNYCRRMERLHKIIPVYTRRKT